MSASTDLKGAPLVADGFPHITSLWFRLAAGRLFCCTQQNAVVTRHLRHIEQVGFELAVNQPPYHGLSGQGTAEMVTQDATALLDELTEHYLEGRNPGLKKWLLSRIATEVVIEIAPLRITSWDFRRRMTSVD